MFLEFEKGNFLESGNATQPLEVACARSVKERCMLFHIFATKMCAFLVEKRKMCKKCVRNMFHAHDKQCSLVLSLGNDSVSDMKFQPPVSPFIVTKDMKRKKKTL